MFAEDSPGMESDLSLPSRSFEPLSQREREILALLAENLSDQEIADRLVLARATVKWYNRQIFNKLGVENRQQAVKSALRLGLLKTPATLMQAYHPLPAQITPFIGRVGELDDVIHLLTHPHTRLLTILAPGGMGKTRLALALAENSFSHYAQGICFVSLTSLVSADSLLSAIADSLGFPFTSDDRLPQQQLLDFLRDKHTLLMLDNFEHLLESASLVADILQGAPKVKVLATSRERLNLAGETVYTLGGMPYPKQPDCDNALDYGAVQLFVECARRADAHFDTRDEASVIRICQLVQGMPLALELAAAWVSTLSTRDIADEIARSADFLRTTMRNIPVRLHSVRAVFETTWKRLTDEQRQVFSRLSVFRGGCTRDAAQVVAQADMETLAELVSKALLWYKPESGRYDIHELLRQYAAEQLELAGEADSILSAHREYFARLAHQWSIALKTPEQLRSLDLLDADMGNIRAAFQRATETGQPEFIEPFTDLWYFYEIRGWYTEAVKIFGSAIDALNGQDSVALGKLLAGQAIFVGAFHEFQKRFSLAEQSIAMLRRLGAEAALVEPFAMLGDAAGMLGDLERQAAIWQEGYALAQHLKDRFAVAVFLHVLGISALLRKDFDEARDKFSQASAAFVNLGNYWGQAFAVLWLGFTALDTGDYEEAERRFEETLMSARKIHHLVNISAGLDGLRRVALIKGEARQAKQFAEDLVKIERNMGSRPRLFEALVWLAEATTACGDYQEARKHLREALGLFADVADASYLLGFGVVTLSVLANTNDRAHIVTLISFLEQLPRQDRLNPREREILLSLKSQMQLALPTDLYTTAWEQGKNVTIDDMLTQLRILIYVSPLPASLSSLSTRKSPFSFPAFKTGYNLSWIL